MTGFPLAQIADMLPSSFVPLESCSVLPKAMLYLVSHCETGVPGLLYHGVKMVARGGGNSLC